MYLNELNKYNEINNKDKSVLIDLLNDYLYEIDLESERTVDNYSFYKFVEFYKNELDLFVEDEYEISLKTDQKTLQDALIVLKERFLKDFVTINEKIENKQYNQVLSYSAYEHYRLVQFLLFVSEQDKNKELKELILFLVKAIVDTVDYTVSLYKDNDLRLDADWSVAYDSRYPTPYFSGEILYYYESNLEFDQIIQDEDLEDLDLSEQQRKQIKKDRKNPKITFVRVLVLEYPSALFETNCVYAIKNIKWHFYAQSVQENYFPHSIEDFVNVIEDESFYKEVEKIYEIYKD
jgi:hypothetical protein